LRLREYIQLEWCSLFSLWFSWMEAICWIKSASCTIWKWREFALSYAYIPWWDIVKYDAEYLVHGHAKLRPQFGKGKPSTWAYIRSHRAGRSIPFDRRMSSKLPAWCAYEILLPNSPHNLVILAFALCYPFIALSLP
jgi:hypothetical protein